MRAIYLVALGLSACATSGPKNIPLVVVQSPAERATYEATGSEYMIAAQGKEASAAAKAMFELGGNSIDAAVAASFVISVERPQSTGLGGGGFMLYREGKTGKIFAIDFRERAPAKATRDMFLDEKGEVVPKKSLNGIFSVATPGLVAGLLEIHRRFGKLTREQVMLPAIHLAEGGLTVYPRLAEALAKRAPILMENPAARKIFLKEDGETYKTGELLVQKDLGRTLRNIARHGSMQFYRGEIAAAILRESEKRHGILQLKDFTSYQVKWREPVYGTFRGFQIYSMPPPSSGGLHVVEILNILEKDNLAGWGALSPKSIHHTAAAMQMAFADRAEYPGDPSFVKVPLKALLSKEYAERLHASITSRARASQDIKPGVFSKDESPETTHFSIVDKSGNAVVSTQTINYSFGSGIVAAGTGILLNDEMDDFSVKPGVANVFGAIGGDANAIAPFKTPLSSMSPTLVMKDGHIVLALGAPGGTRIISCVSEVILNYLVYGMPLYDAVASLRFHHQWLPDRLDMDLPGPGTEIVKELEAMGYHVQLGDDEVFCRVEAVAVDGSGLRGVADPRDLGASLGR